MTRTRIAAILAAAGAGYLVAQVIAVPLIPILSAWVYGDLLPRLAEALAR